MGYTIALRGMTGQLIMNTTQIYINSTSDDANEGPAGSGFFFKFQHGTGDLNTIPVLVSNRHVLEKADFITIFMHRLDKEKSEISLYDHGAITINDVQKICVYHPDKEVDLAVMLMGPLLNDPELSKNQFMINYLDESSVPTIDRLCEFDPIVDLIMVGYPKKVRDIQHNIPIFRKGITATPPAVQYGGKPIFLVDIATWRGSSGSPVLLYYPWHYNNNNENREGGKMLLLGIIAKTVNPYDGTQLILNNAEVKTAFRIPIHLGVAVQSRKLLEIKEQIVETLSKFGL